MGGIYGGQPFQDRVGSRVLSPPYSILSIIGVNASLLTDDDCHVLSVDRTILFAVIELRV